MKPNHILFWKVFTKDCVWNAWGIAHKKWIISNLNQAKQVFNFILFFIFLSFLLLLLFFGSDGLSRWSFVSVPHLFVHKSHVPSVAKIETALIGALVGSSLQSNNCVACSQLLLSEVSFISISLLRSDGALTIFGSLSLNNHINLRQALIKKSSCETVSRFFFVLPIFLFTLRPSAWRQMTTAFRFCFSHKSTVWNSSWDGTPNDLA